MTVEDIAPLRDARWPEFVSRHPNASVFHTRGWLQALQCTYGFEPHALVIPSSGGIRSALAYCRLQSWLRGRRLVSLPFSDQCEPLVADPADCELLCTALARECVEGKHRFAEVRPSAVPLPANTGFAKSQEYWLHRLDLRPALGDLFRSLDKDSIQRRIRRAEREGLAWERGNDLDRLKTFYDLQVRTRRRHSLPPQPPVWFQNLLTAMGDNLSIRIARKGTTPVAATITLSFRNTVFYKYGCSDERYHNLGGMPLLFWKMIEEAKAEGASTLDLGRSDPENLGLLRFKEQWNAAPVSMTYWRFPVQAAKARTVGFRWQRVFSALPDPLLVQCGRFLYRHFE